MKLLPSLKPKKRYLVFELLSSAHQKFSLSEVEAAVNQAFLDFLGQLGTAKAAPLFLKEKFHQNKQRFVLKVNHNQTDQAKAALSLIKKIKNTSVIISSLTTSGTLKKANKILNEVN